MSARSFAVIRGVRLTQSACPNKTRQAKVVMSKKTKGVVTLRKSERVVLDYSKIRKAVLVLRAVNHKLRQRIIDLIRDNETMTVTDIYTRLRLEQSVASQHLAILRRARVMFTERQGKFIYYSVDEDRLVEIQILVEGLIS